MEFDNAFEVPLPPDQAWKILMDVQRIAPCMPGAELTEVIDENSYKGKVSVRLGPVALTFAGTARIEDRDDVNHTAKVKAQGSDSKGRGGAQADVGFKLVPAGDKTRVEIHTNMNLSGSVAQYGRGVGMISDLAGTIIKQFATNLEKNVLAERAAAPAPAAAPAAPAATGAASPQPATAAPQPPQPQPRPAPQPAKPISGFTLFFQVLMARIRRMFGAKA